MTVNAKIGHATHCRPDKTDITYFLINRNYYMISELEKYDEFSQIKKDK